MPLADFTAIDSMWIALSAFLVLIAVGLVYMLFRLGATLGSLGSFIHGLENEVLPVINKSGGTVDRVNLQLDKVDRVTDSAVDAADSVDTAVRAVTMAITRPVQRISGFAAGVAHGAAALRARRNWRDAVDVGREAAARRERELAEELGRDGADRDL